MPLANEFLWVAVLTDTTGQVPQATLDQMALDYNLWCETVLGQPAPLAWGAPTAVRVASNAPLAVNESVIQVLRGAPPTAGELADHGTTPDDTENIVGRVYLDAVLNGRTLADGLDDFTEAASHEIAEARLDRWLNGCRQAPDGTIWAFEIADATQGSGRRYGQTWCANITLPNYWKPSASGRGPFDAHGALTGPYQTLPSGYSQKWNGSKWTMLDEHVAAMPDWKRDLMARGLGRLARRAGKGSVDS